MLERIRCFVSRIELSSTPLSVGACVFEVPEIETMSVDRRDPLSWKDREFPSEASLEMLVLLILLKKVRRRMKVCRINGWD